MRYCLHLCSCVLTYWNLIDSAGAKLIDIISADDQIANNNINHYAIFAEFDGQTNFRLNSICFRIEPSEMHLHCSVPQFAIHISDSVKIPHHLNHTKNRSRKIITYTQRRYMCAHCACSSSTFQLVSMACVHFCEREMFYIYSRTHANPNNIRTY